jgi:hypothetical protein
MVKSKKLNQLVSILLVAALAFGFFQFPSPTALEASGIDDAAQVTAYSPGEEIISERTETAKK